MDVIDTTAERRQKEELARRLYASEHTPKRPKPKPEEETITNPWNPEDVL